MSGGGIKYHTPIKLKKNKGFTLIELLAVIVILAIIALIAVPTVINIIERAREGAAKSSAYSYIKAVETYIVTSKLDKKLEQLNAGETYTITKLNELVKLKGTKPTEGSVVISNKNSVASATLIINGYTISYNGTDDSYTINTGQNNNGSSASLFSSVTLVEKELFIDFPKTTNDLKNYVDELLDALIEAGTDKMDITELTALKTAEVTWTSSDPNIIKVDGDKVTGLKEGKTNVIGTASTGERIVIPFDVSSVSYLSDRVNVGDYVAYDAGTWTETVARPTAHKKFGGYTAGDNKATSISWCANSTYATELKGWRVLDVDKDNRIVTLIHAGIPECYYHTFSYSYTRTVIEEIVGNLNNRATEQYLNTDYATSARMMGYSDTILVSDKTIINAIGTNYWMALASGSNNLWYVNVYGTNTNSTDGTGSMGVRPVVVLKANIKTTTKEKDALGQDAWVLLKP